MLKKFFHKILPSFFKKTNSLVLFINIAPWKRFIFNNMFSPNHVVKYLPLNKNIVLIEKELVKFNDIKIIIWGYPNYEFYDSLENFIKKTQSKIIRVEDGFVRSFGLGVDHIAPRSICFDSRSLYFNSKICSDLEFMISNKDKYLTTKLINDAQKFRKIFIDLEITKYNLNKTNLANKLYGDKTNLKRVLCIGQCEKDASIAYGSPKIKTNLELCRIAREENPTAQIIFKQHPDEVGKRNILEEISKYCDLVIIENMSLNDSLTGVDIVYTISSLFGFEALLRDVKVRTLGVPFYSGYGLTSDYINHTNRNVKLTIDELFAFVYLIYPTYIDVDGNKIPYEECFNYFIEQKKLMSKS